MLTSVQVKALKKMNASRDAEKSKARISEDFKAASNKIKLDIIELSGQTRSSFYRTFETGNASLKTILSIAQILNVSPYYYSGVDEDKGSFSEDALIRFLKDYGCHDLVAELKSTATRRKRKPKKTIDNQEEIIIEETDDITDENVDEGTEEIPEIDNCEVIIEDNQDADNSKKMQDAISSLDEESAVLLLKALFKRAEAGGNAEELSRIVKRCLLS